MGNKNNWGNHTKWPYQLSGKVWFSQSYDYCHDHFKEPQKRNTVSSVASMCIPPPRAYHHHARMTSFWEGIYLYHVARINNSWLVTGVQSIPITSQFFHGFYHPQTWTLQIANCQHLQGEPVIFVASCWFMFKPSFNIAMWILQPWLEVNLGTRHFCTYLL